MLEIIEPGLLTTIQDGGRRGWARYGVPPSGPMDATALHAANHLVGNAPDAAGLEITLTGPTLRIWQESLIAVCGAEFDVWVNRLPVPTWHAVYVRTGQCITFGQRHSGARAYLAVSGGIAQSEFLGSQATYLKGKFGGFQGRALKPGDQLLIGKSPSPEPVSLAGKSWPHKQRTPYTPNPTLRVMLGPQTSYFTQSGIETFRASTYTITQNADRMGFRLQGPTIAHKGPTGITSDGIVTGSIQIPPDGQPIVMMVDHQTTGGYPKIATVIQSDIALLAQCLPGDSVQFRQIV